MKKVDENVIWLVFWLVLAALVIGGCTATYKFELDAANEKLRIERGLR